MKENYCINVVNITAKILIGKAENDFEAAAGLKKLGISPSSICFHCQQCVEKYLKAYLLYKEQLPPFTHDLDHLVQKCTLHDNSYFDIQNMAASLNPYAVDVRNEEEVNPTKLTTHTAYKICQLIRKFVRKRLPRSLKTKLQS